MKTVNIIYYDNGVGLQKDYVILNSVLKKYFNTVSINAGYNTCSSADINIFLQNVDSNTSNFLNKANVNILVPNLEWMLAPQLEILNKFDIIFAKSRYCKEMLAPLHNNIIYTGFTSVDRYIEHTKKTNAFLHLAGKSIQKYTELVMDVFSKSNIPITVLDSTCRFQYKVSKNITYIPHYLSDLEIDTLLNSHKFHICCSLAEGWGHYIYEALSCKSVVLINDAPPYNELLSKDISVFIKSTDECIAKKLDFSENKEYPLRKIYYTDKEDFKETIDKILTISDEEFETRSKNSRCLYERIDSNFKERITSLIENSLL